MNNAMLRDICVANLPTLFFKFFLYLTIKPRLRPIHRGFALHKP